MIDIEHRMGVSVEYLEDDQRRVTCNQHLDFTWTGPADETDRAIREHVGDNPEEP